VLSSECNAVTFESFFRGGLAGVENAVVLAGVAKAVALYDEYMNLIIIIEN
jgi:hypothetical protein